MDLDNFMGTSRQQAQGTRINQPPELSLSAEVEPYAKGGWKTTVRASVRVFDGNHQLMYDQLSASLAHGLAIAQQAIDDHTANQAQKETTTNE